jgi:hypothetical protein
MIARLWDGAEACGRFAGWLFRWMFALAILWQTAVSGVGSLLAPSRAQRARILGAHGEALRAGGLN